MATTIEASDGRQPPTRRPKRGISHTTRNIIAGGTLTIAALGAAIAGARGLEGKQHQNPAVNTGNTISASKQEPKSQNTLELLRKAPDFQAKTIDGQTFRLSDYRGKPIILYFESYDETSARIKDNDFYEMANAAKAHRDKNLTFIVVAWNDKESISLVKDDASVVVLEETYKRRGTQDNNLHDGVRIAETFMDVGLGGYPATFYIKPDSTISTLVSGRNQQTPGSIDANIQKILQ